MGEIEILSTRDNPLLERQEVEVLVRHDSKSTPKRLDLLVQVSKLLKADQELVLVDRITTSKGQSLTKGRVLVYKKKEFIPKDKAEKLRKRTEKKKS